MMKHLKRLFAQPKEKAITIRDVDPANRDPQIERETTVANTQLYAQLDRVERRSWEIRQLLATNTLELLNGEKK